MEDVKWMIELKTIIHFLLNTLVISSGVPYSAVISTEA